MYFQGKDDASKEIHIHEPKSDALEEFNKPANAFLRRLLSPGLNGMESDLFRPDVEEVQFDKLQIEEFVLLNLFLQVLKQEEYPGTAEAGADKGFCQIVDLETVQPRRTSTFDFFTSPSPVKMNLRILSTI